MTYDNQFWIGICMLAALAWGYFLGLLTMFVMQKEGEENEDE